MLIQEHFYEPLAPDPWCMFAKDYTYSSSLFVQQVTYTFCFFVT